VRIEQRASRVCTVIQDQGIGIPADSVPRLFTRFYRADNVNPHNISGMGIGLFVVKEIVTLHGGTIEVASQES
jgi:signal transduction histidine kinase